MSLKENHKYPQQSNLEKQNEKPYLIYLKDDFKFKNKKTRFRILSKDLHQQKDMKNPVYLTVHSLKYRLSKYEEIGLTQLQIDYFLK